MRVGERGGERKGEWGVKKGERGVREREGERVWKSNQCVPPDAAQYNQR